MFERILAETRGLRSIGRTLAHRLENPQFYVSLALVLLLHLALIWALASALVLPRGPQPDGRWAEVALVGSPPASQPKPDPVPEPQLQVAVSEAVAPPDIEIQEPASPAGAVGAGSAVILPPRPDPAIRNVNPALPAALAKIGSQAEVLLTILVEADGSIGDARVAKSSGTALLDQLAQNFAKANWRFRAATANGAAVADWTTVLVKFAPAG
jgi:periplasmic protein TonB